MVLEVWAVECLKCWRLKFFSRSFGGTVLWNMESLGS